MFTYPDPVQCLGQVSLLPGNCQRTSINNCNQHDIVARYSNSQMLRTPTNPCLCHNESLYLYCTVLHCTALSPVTRTPPRAPSQRVWWTRLMGKLVEIGDMGHKIESHCVGGKSRNIIMVSISQGSRNIRITISTIHDMTFTREGKI